MQMIQKVEYIVKAQYIQLRIHVKQGILAVNLSTQLINETIPDMNMTAEKLAIFLCGLSNKALNQTLQLHQHQLSILVATLGKYRKVYIKCPISRLESIIDRSVQQSQHQICKWARLATEQKLREVEKDNLELKIIVEHLRNQVASQEIKLTQTLNYVKQELENIKREHISKIGELSILIEEKNSSMFM